MRTRIIGLAVWASVLSIGLFGVPLAVVALQFMLQYERGELLRVADAIAITVAGDVSDEDPIRDVERPSGVDVAVFDEHGELLRGTPHPGDAADVAMALSRAVAERTEEDQLIVAVPVTHEDDVIGAVRVTAPRDPVLQDVALLWGAMGALAALAVTATWAVARRQARRLALPLEDLAVGAHRLGAGDFSVRVPAGGIAEIDSVGAALNTTAARLDDLLARERAFSADASHQLRTPLAGLRLRLEAALDQPDRDLRLAVAGTLDEADRLETTIDELLTLARSGPTPRADLADLAEILDELAPQWRERLALQGRDLDVVVEAGARAARVSAAAVRQVLAVLVENATEHGRGTVAVTARESADAVAIAIDVTDEGPGVREPLNVLFARRSDPRDTHGLGLALARRLAEAEGGRLELSRPSPPVFTLLVPSADEEVPAARDAVAAAVSR